MRGLVIATLLLLIVGTAPLRAQERLQFAVISDENSETLDKIWAPILAGMSKATGYDVVPLYFNDYAGTVWALSTKRAQLAWVGNRIAIEAVDHADCEVAVQIEAVGDVPGYRSLLILKSDSPLSSVDEVMANARDLSLGFGDRNSTSGYLMPNYYLFSTKGLNPKDLFRKLSFSNHEANFLAVAQGQIDIAVVGSIYMPVFKERYPDQFAHIKVIWTSPLIPSEPIVWRKDLPSKAKSAIRAFLLNLGKPKADKTAGELAEEKTALARLGGSGFRVSDNGQLTETRKIELYRRKIEMESSPMDPGLKKTRLDALQKELDQLQSH